ncbi:transcriptional repressor [Pedobacter psychrodurus]|uniref:transcriptional repressor n=2 Tax=Pedobacter TaxID=84567 RepID=UPI00292D9346|nr:transcriptional repressor [Pedobacter psychrodurus]
MKNIQKLFNTAQSISQLPQSACTDAFKETILKTINDYCRLKRLLFSEKRLWIAFKLLEVSDFTHPESLWLMLKEDKMPISIGCVYSNLKLMEAAGIAEAQSAGSRLILYKIRAAHH